ncbi:MAG: glycerate kinase, partial [Gammaproteobacteria bacterium]
MKIIIAPDSFKESLSAVRAAAALARGLCRSLPDAQCVVLPIGDGGEGTLAALLRVCAGRWQEAEVSGPLGDPVSARYALLGDGATAV